MPRQSNIANVFLTQRPQRRTRRTRRFFNAVRCCASLFSPATDGTCPAFDGDRLRTRCPHSNPQDSYILIFQTRCHSSIIIQNQTRRVGEALLSIDCWWTVYSIAALFLLKNTNQTISNSNMIQ